MTTSVEISLSDNPIQRPDEPRHFMVINPLPCPAAAELAGCQLAYSDEALKVQEVGHAIYAPVIYFPQQHVRMEYLTLSEKSTECPLKGVTEYYDIRLHGKIYKHAAWIYKTVYEFDERLQLLQGQMAFDTAAVQVLELTTIALPPL